MGAPQSLTTAYGWATRGVVKFGGLPLPVVGTTMSYIDLNDTVYYYTHDVQIDGTHPRNTAAQRSWLGQGVWLSQDFVGRKITLSTTYDEAGNGGTAQSIAAAMGQLTQAGEQYLTFDNITAVKCRFDGWSKRSLNTFDGRGFVWDTELVFQSRNAFFEDLSSTTQSVGAVSGGVGGTDNNFNISYAGAVYVRPVYTLTIPSGNTRTISSIVLKNLTSGETATVAFSPVITSGVAHTVVIDSDGMQALLDGVQVPITGSFPNAYPSIPPPQVNSMRLTITSAVGATTGLTFSLSYTTRWEG